MKHRIKQEILTEVKGLIQNESPLSSFRGSAGGHLGGVKVRELEELLCDYLGVKYAVTMNSATSALMAACIACNIKDSYVITPPVSFSASASCILQAGGKIKWCDIEDEAYGIDLLSFNGDLLDCKAIIAVHLHGHPCDMGVVERLANAYSLKIIEDNSQSLGSVFRGQKTGSIGDCSVLSFNQWKHIQCGEGGALLTNDDEICRIARLVRNHGETQSEVLGYNFRLTELQAAVLIPQVKHINEILDPIIELSERLTYRLKDVPELKLPVVKTGCKHVYYSYTIRYKQRNRLQDELAKDGIYFGKGGYTPIHLIPFYGGKRGDMPVAEDCYDNVMFTNILRPPMKLAEVDRIAEKIKECICRINHS